MIIPVSQCEPAIGFIILEIVGHLFITGTIGNGTAFDSIVASHHVHKHHG